MIFLWSRIQGMMIDIFSWFRLMSSWEKGEDVAAYAEYLKDMREFINRHSEYDLFVLDCGDIVGNALSLFSFI